MSREALKELRAVLQVTLMRAGGDLNAARMDELAADLKSRIWLFVGASPDLIWRGTDARQRDQGRVNWARALVGEMLRDVEFVERAARGLADVLEDEARLYRRDQERRRRRL